MHNYIARQPIFNKKAEIYAYELLFRRDAKERSYSGTNADQASSRVVMDSFQSMGLDAVTGGKPAFINFTSTLLLENIATLFPKNQLVIELLEDIEPTPEIMEVCRNLRQNGYTLALDDFIFRPELLPLVNLCQIIKFDFLACTPPQISAMLQKMNVSGKLLLAEKIENNETFNLAVDLGFTLFQGYFLSKPVTMVSKEISPLKINYMALLQEINSGYDLNFTKIANIVHSDVALSYKMLRMINSAYFSLPAEVTDIRHAIALLGTQEIRKWVFLMALMGLNSDKPNEMVRISMIRGRFMEKLGALCRLPYSAENIYLVGLFSLIDQLLEQPMNVALSGVVAAPEIFEALLEQKGVLFTILSIVISMEQGEWDETDRLAASLSLDAQQVGQVYLDAVKWCNEIPF